MNYLRNLLKSITIFSFTLLILFYPFDIAISAEEAGAWEKVASTNDGIQYIEKESIKYDNKGILSVLTKYSEINPETKEIINTSLYEMKIDCKKRDFKDISVNGKVLPEKGWTDSNNDKLIKKTIIKSCTY